MKFDEAYRWYVAGNALYLATTQKYKINACTLSDEDAMQLSIEKWEGLLEKRREHGEMVRCNSWVGVESCPLCMKYYYRPNCEGCPVKMYTGKPVCRDTPYKVAQDYPTVKNLQAEIKFLKKVQSLLLEGELK